MIYRILHHIKLILRAFDINQQTAVVRRLLSLAQLLSVVFAHVRLGLVLEAVGLEDERPVKKLPLVPAERLPDDLLVVAPALG